MDVRGVGDQGRGESPGSRSPDGRRSRWEEHKAERRRQILRAAVVVIERGARGEEVRVQQIADQAGIGRSVLYRHFTDRADLDRAVQAHVLADLRDRLMPEVTLSGSIQDIVERIVSVYVDWAASHPALHRLAEREPPEPSSTGPLERAISELVEEVVTVISTGAALLGVEFSEDDSASLEPLMFGVVGLAFGAVRRWLRREVREPSPEAFSRFLARTIWHAIDGHARDRGVELDPTAPLDDLIAAAFAELAEPGAPG